MGNYADTMQGDRFLFLEVKAEQIRKMMLGSLLLAKDAWKDALLLTPEGQGVLKTVEEAEDAFMDPTLTDPLEKLDDVLSLINRRARAVFVLLDYLTQHKGDQK